MLGHTLFQPDEDIILCEPLWSVSHNEINYVLVYAGGIEFSILLALIRIYRVGGLWKTANKS